MRAARCSYAGVEIADDALKGAINPHCITLDSRAEPHLYSLFAARETRHGCLRCGSRKVEPETSLVLIRDEPLAADERWMREALRAADEAAHRGEVPVGSVIVGADNSLVARDGNRTRGSCDPTAHAEILVLRRAASEIGNYRLTGATLYATLEPCAMCAGALIQARISRLVFAAHDLRAGAIESVFRIVDNSSLNHKIEWTGGVLATEARAQLQAFFRDRR